MLSRILVLSSWTPSIIKENIHDPQLESTSSTIPQPELARGKKGKWDFIQRQKYYHYLKQDTGKQIENLIIFHIFQVESSHEGLSYGGGEGEMQRTFQ